MWRSRRKPFWPCCALGRSNIVTDRATDKGDWKRILPGLVVSLVSLAIVFSFIDLRELGAALRQAAYRYLLYGMLVTVVWLLVRGMAWRTLLQEKASYSDIFFTLNEGYLLNNILPFRLGEVGRAFLLGRKAGLDFWQVLSTIVIERTLDLGFAVGIFLSTLPFVVGATWARQAATGTGVVVLGGLLTLYLLARNQAGALEMLDRLGQRWPLIHNLAGQRIPAFFSGLAVLTDPRRFLVTVFWISLNWLIGVGQYYVLLLAFFPETKPLWATFSLGAGALGIAAPSSPGAVGVFEAALVGALSVFKLNPSTAAAFALLTHFVNYFVTGILGGYALSREGETLSSLYRRVQNIQKAEKDKTA